MPSKLEHRKETKAAKPRSGRLQHLEKILLGQGWISVDSLANALGVSSTTARSDLSLLARAGFVERCHGGARWIAPLGLGAQPQRLPGNTNELGERLCKVAVRHVRDFQSVAVEGGIYAERIFQELSSKNELVVATNALPLPIGAFRKSRLHVSGGELAWHQMRLVGGAVQAFFDDLYVDVSLIGVDAIDIDSGITCQTLPDAAIKRALIDCAKHVVILASSLSIGRRQMYPVRPQRQRQMTLITDHLVSSMQLDALMTAGYEVETS